MQHLRLESIARIADEPPTAEEAAHLEACEQCRRELDEMREDIHALSLLPDMAPVPEAWGALERRLADEGLIRTLRPSFGMNTRWLQAAAAVIVFAGGALAGRITMQPQTTVAQNSTQNVESATSQPQDFGARTSPVSLASTGAPTYAQPRTVEEAAALLREMEEPYFDALTRYAELATGSPVGDPVARLAALQAIVNTTAAALSQAPTDPVVNGYHLTALAQRDAALRQVAAATGERWY